MRNNNILEEITVRNNNILEAAIGDTVRSVIYRLCDWVPYLWVSDSVSHDILPVLVHLLEQLAFLWHLSHDVFRGEDGL